MWHDQERDFWPLLPLAIRRVNRVEAPPSRSSLFGEKGTGSATMDTGSGGQETNEHADAVRLVRQETRHDDARGTDPDDEGVTFDAGQR